MARAHSELLAKLGLNPAPPVQVESLFIQALTHSSVANDPDYERLEFLGDAVLKLAISHQLYERFPDLNEGELTKIRARVVSDHELAEIARSVDVGAYVRLGLSELRSGGKTKTGTLAAVLEALLGATYLAHGWSASTALVGRLFDEVIARSAADPGSENYKALLQETTQERYGTLPVYEDTGGEGPQHQHIFFVQVSLEGKLLGVGRGPTKKAAQQDAAREALDALKAREEQP